MLLAAELFSLQIIVKTFMDFFYSPGTVVSDLHIFKSAMFLPLRQVRYFQQTLGVGGLDICALGYFSRLCVCVCICVCMRVSHQEKWERRGQRLLLFPWCHVLK